MDERVRHRTVKRLESKPSQVAWLPERALTPLSGIWGDVRAVSHLRAGEPKVKPADWVGKMRLGPGIFILTLRRGAHRAGVGKIRLGPGNIGLLGSGAHQAGVGKIRLGAGVLVLTLRRGARRTRVGKIRLGPGNIGLLGSGAHRAGIRLGPGDIGLLGSGWRRKDPSWSRGFNSYFKERRSPGWGREDPSRSRGFSSYSKERRFSGWGREDPSRTWEYRSPR